MLRKNTASQVLAFAGINATTGAALTGATFSYRRCIDGTFGAGGGTITEDTGTGFYKVALAQADTNGNNLAFFFTATNAIPVCINALTTAADPSDTVRYGLTALPNVASGSAGAIVTSGTGTAQLSVSSGLVTLAGVTHTGAVIPTVTTVTSEVTANVTKISGSAAAADNLEESTEAIAYGTVDGTGATTTVFLTSALTPDAAVADQFKGRVLIFKSDTTTAALRGQATTISSHAYTSAEVITLTVVALTTAPSTGDTFAIL